MPPTHTMEELAREKRRVSALHSTNSLGNLRAAVDAHPTHWSVVIDTTALAQRHAIRLVSLRWQDGQEPKPIVMRELPQDVEDVIASFVNVAGDAREFRRRVGVYRNAADELSEAEAVRTARDMAQYAPEGDARTSVDAEVDDGWERARRAFLDARRGVEQLTLACADARAALWRGYAPPDMQKCGARIYRELVRCKKTMEGSSECIT